MSALAEAQVLDPTITLDNVADKVGLRRYQDDWRRLDAEITRAPAGEDLPSHRFRVWEERHATPESKRLYSNDVAYAILREANPKWKHEGCSMGSLCPWR